MQGCGVRAFGFQGGNETASCHLLQLPRDEMAFRARYLPLLISKTLTVVFRPGDRRWPNWRGYIEGEIVTARIIRRCGSDALGIAPEFTPHRIPIRIRSVRVMPVNRLKPAHFAGSSPDVTNRQQLIDHLFEIYGRPIESYGSQITRIAFEYLTQDATHPDQPT